MCLPTKIGQELFCRTMPRQMSLSDVYGGWIMKLKTLINEHKIKLLFLNILALFPLICFILPHYSVVSYEIERDYIKHIDDFLGSMRYFGALIIKLWTSLFDPITDPRIDIIVYIVLTALITTAFSIFLLRKLEAEDKWSLTIINTSVILSVANVWINDILTFPECIFLLSIGNILCFSSIMVYYEKKIKAAVRYPAAGLLLICATAVYQQYLVVFIIYAVLISGSEVVGNADCSKKKAVLTYVRLIVFGIVSELIYFEVGKWIQTVLGVKPNSRIAFSLDTITQNIQYFLTHQHSFLKGRGFFNTEELTLSYALVALVWLVALVLFVRKNKAFFQCALYVLSCSTAYCSSYFMGLISTSRGTRTMFGLFSVFALFSVGTVRLLNKRVIKCILSIVLVLLYGLNMIKTVEMSVNQYQTNSVDIANAKIYVNEIEKYEARNNITVSRVLFCKDANSDMGINSALCYADSVGSVLYFVSGRNFQVSEMSENQYRQSFSSHDWKQCDPTEQMVFDQDTVYICVY